MNICICTMVGLIILATSYSAAAVITLDIPAMAVKVDAGDYTVLGSKISVKEPAELNIVEQDRVIVLNEKCILVDEQPQMYSKGTVLKKTLGPVDTQVRLPYVIDPDSVKVHSELDGGHIYQEGKDYFLDRVWGGISRLSGGDIPKDSQVYVDYAVFLERIDLVQVDADGKAAIKNGVPAPVMPVIPTADYGCIPVAHIYLPPRTNTITQQNIYALPATNKKWQDYIKVSGAEYLSNTLAKLKERKPVTIVCWGDSVTEGASPSSHDKCYVELFRSRLQKAYPDNEIRVINAGIGGSNTDTRRDGYEKEVLSYNPDLITVEFVNDLGKSPDKIKANWSDFISRAREKNPSIEFILLTPHYVMPGWMGNFENAVSAMRQTASDNKVALGDTSNIWENLRAVGIPYQSLLANGINHPNDLGHELFTANLMKLMMQSR